MTMSGNIFARSVVVKQFFFRRQGEFFAAVHWKKFRQSVGTDF